MVNNKKQDQLILTEDEKQLILDNRKKKEAVKPKKIGFLKEDLFRVKEKTFNISSFLLTLSKVNEEITKFSGRFEFIAPKRTKFVCFIDFEAEFWYDDEGFGIENMSNAWGECYLTDIKEI